MPARVLGGEEAEPERREHRAHPVQPGGAVVAFEHVTKRFGAVTALDDVSLELRRGEIRVLGKGPLLNNPERPMTYILNSILGGFLRIFRYTSTRILAAAIGLFAGMYGIIDFHLVLACEDSVFWLEDHDGVIYFWSRIDDSMIRGGDNLEVALTNYLFHQENLYYVDEITRKLVPINAYDKKTKE